MDQLARHYFGMTFKVRFIEARGDDFQRLFGQIMNFRYPGDFTQTRPWGALGDDKCDGYLPSQRRFYQCYAPEELKKSETLQKLKEDFGGALPHKGKFFDVWVFVHNAGEGRLPFWLTFKLQEMRKSHPDMKIETLGYIELLQEALALDQLQLVDLFGHFPSLRDVLAVQFEDIRPLLEFVGRQAYPDDPNSRPVPSSKLEFNRLSEDVAYFLKTGMIKANTVGDYLDRTCDKELATRVTGAFRAEYERLKQQEEEPDAIFRALRVFLQGHFVQTPRSECAGLAILAYLFEQCDIFERPPES